MSTMDLFGGRLLIIADFVFTLVFFLRFGFINAMGSSLDVKSIDPRILIKLSMFFSVCCCATAYSVDWSIIYNSGGLWWSTSTLL
jgi:hypothetical protein